MIFKFDGLKIQVDDDGNNNRMAIYNLKIVLFGGREAYGSGMKQSLPFWSSFLTLDINLFYNCANEIFTVGDIKQTPYPMTFFDPNPRDLLLPSQQNDDLKSITHKTKSQKSQTVGDKINMDNTNFILIQLQYYSCFSFECLFNNKLKRSNFINYWWYCR